MLTIDTILERLAKLRDVWASKNYSVFSDEELNEFPKLGRDDLNKISNEAFEIYEFYRNQKNSPLKGKGKKTRADRENKRKELFDNAIEHLQVVLDKFGITPIWLMHVKSDPDSQSNGEFKGDASDPSVISTPVQVLQLKITMAMGQILMLLIPNYKPETDKGGQKSQDDTDQTIVAKVNRFY